MGKNWQECLTLQRLGGSTSLGRKSGARMADKFVITVSRQLSDKLSERLDRF